MSPDIWERAKQLHKMIDELMIDTYFAARQPRTLQHLKHGN